VLTVLQFTVNRSSAWTKPDGTTAQDAQVAELRMDCGHVLGKERHIIFTICIFALELEGRHHVICIDGIAGCTHHPQRGWLTFLLAIGGWLRIATCHSAFCSKYR